MATLHLLGAPSPGPFPRPFDPSVLGEIYIENDNEHEFFEEVLDRTLEAPRPVLVRDRAGEIDARLVTEDLLREQERQLRP